MPLRLGDVLATFRPASEVTSFRGRGDLYFAAEVFSGEPVDAIDRDNDGEITRVRFEPNGPGPSRSRR